MAIQVFIKIGILQLKNQAEKCEDRLGLLFIKHIQGRERRHLKRQYVLKGIQRSCVPQIYDIGLPRVDG